MSDADRAPVGLPGPSAAVIAAGLSVIAHLAVLCDVLGWETESLMLLGVTRLLAASLHAETIPGTPEHDLAAAMLEVVTLRDSNAPAPDT